MCSPNGLPELYTTPYIGGAGNPAGDGSEPLLPGLPHDEAVPGVLRGRGGRVGHAGAPLPHAFGRPGEN